MSFVFDIRVPGDLYEEVAQVCGVDYANSYLHGATLADRRLLPRTQMAWSRLRERADAMDIFRRRDIALVKPEPWTPERRMMQAA